MNHKYPFYCSLVVAVFSFLLLFDAAIISGSEQAFSAYYNQTSVANSLTFITDLIIISLSFFLAGLGVCTSFRIITNFIFKVLRLKSRTLGLSFSSSVMDNHSALIYMKATAKINGRWLNQIKHEL